MTILPRSFVPPIADVPGIAFVVVVLPAIPVQACCGTDPGPSGLALVDGYGYKIEHESES